MSRQLWARGVWSIAVAVIELALAIAGAQQNNPRRTRIRIRRTHSSRTIFSRATSNRAIRAPLQQGPMGTFQRNGELRGMAMHNDVDHYLIKVLAKANKDEIEMGKLAQQRSSNPEVKQLANQLVQDHTRFLSSLESLKHNGQPATNRQAGNQPIQQGTAFRGVAPGTIEQQQPQQGQQQPLNNPNQVNPGQNNFGRNNAFQNNAGQANNETMAGRRAHHDQMAGMGEHGTAGQFAKIMEEVDRNLQQSMVRELSSKQGAEFDRCFLTGQVFGHMWVVEALKVFERDASPQLKPLLQEGLQTSEQHLTHVKSLLAKLDNEPASHAGIQPRATPPFGNEICPNHRTRESGAPSSALFCAVTGRAARLDGV